MELTRSTVDAQLPINDFVLLYVEEDKQEAVDLVRRLKSFGWSGSLHDDPAHLSRETDEYRRMEGLVNNSLYVLALGTEAFFAEGGFVSVHRSELLTQSVFREDKKNSLIVIGAKQKCDRSKMGYGFKSSFVVDSSSESFEGTMHQLFNSDLARSRRSVMEEQLSQQVQQRPSFNLARLPHSLSTPGEHRVAGSQGLCTSMSLDLSLDSSFDRVQAFSAPGNDTTAQVLPQAECATDRGEDTLRGSQCSPGRVATAVATLSSQKKSAQGPDEEARRSDKEKSSSCKHNGFKFPLGEPVEATDPSGSCEQCLGDPNCEYDETLPSVTAPHSSSLVTPVEAADRSSIQFANSRTPDLPLAGWSKETAANVQEAPDSSNEGSGSSSEGNTTVLAEVSDRSTTVTLHDPHSGTSNSEVVPSVGEACAIPARVVDGRYVYDDCLLNDGSTV